MEQFTLGEQISERRKQLGLTQSELAHKCRLDIRTIQRIENGEVTPRFYSIRLINEVMGMKLDLNREYPPGEEDLIYYRDIFRRRKRIRIITFITAMFILVFAGFHLLFNSGYIFGLPKSSWAPFLYLIMFAHLFGIGLTWRCPACNGLLGDVFDTKFCSKCGFRFE
ncbi:multiprotein-bridging factor 1 family protein [Bacteroidota bacterium]